MILTDYYKGEHLTDRPKTRYDIVASTGSYQSFEDRLRNKKGEQFFYFSDVPDRFRFAGKERPDKAITKGENISSVFVPDPALPFAFGDIRATGDALLMIFSDNYRIIELFISRGQRNNRRNLYILLADHELDHELDILRNRAAVQ
jgi:hypothetical protein